MGSLVQIQSPRPFFSSFRISCIVAPRPAGPQPRDGCSANNHANNHMSVVVLTNDDGVHAPGLAALEKALAELGEVYVVAPEREASAGSRSTERHPTA